MGSKQLDLYLVSCGTREYTSQIQVTWPLATPLLLNNVLEYKWMSTPEEAKREWNKMVLQRQQGEKRAKEWTKL